MFFQQTIREYRKRRERVQKWREYKLNFWRIGDCIYAAMLNVDVFGVNREDFFKNYRRGHGFRVTEYSFDVDDTLSITIFESIPSTGGDLEWYNKRSYDERKELGVSTTRLRDVVFYLNKVRVDLSTNDAAVISRKIIREIREKIEKLAKERKSTLEEYLKTSVSEDDKMVPQGDVDSVLNEE